MTLKIREIRVNLITANEVLGKNSANRLGKSMS